MAVPQVTATPNKQSYAQGETVVVQFTVAADTINQATTRTITWTGHDNEGNAASGTFTVTDNIPVADGFTLDSVTWQDTGVSFAVSGLQATGTA